MNISLSPLVDLVISANKKGNQTYATEVLTYLEKQTTLEQIFVKVKIVGSNHVKQTNK